MNQNDALIAAQLQKLIESEYSVRLPSVRVLAKQFGIRVATMSRILHHLSDRGILELGKGRPARIVGRVHTPKPIPVSAVDETAQIIRRRIIEGEYRAGHPLPKLRRLAADCGVGLGTAAKACRKLFDEGVLRKSGKRWIPGGEPRRALLDAQTGHYIEIVVPGMGVWQRFRSPRTEALIRSFLAERDRYPLSLSLTIMGGDSKPSVPTPDISTSPGTNRLSTCLGRLILGRLHEFNDPRSLLISPSITPTTIWIDDSESTPPFPFERKDFYRFGFSEQSFSLAALRYLVEKGHSKCVFYADKNTFDIPWVRNRLQILSESAEKIAPTTELTYIRDLREQIQNTPLEELISLLQNTHGTAGGFVKKLISVLIDMTERVDSASDFFSTTPADTVFARLAVLLKALMGRDPRLVSRFPFLRDIDDISPLVLSADMTALILSHDKLAQRIQNVFARTGVRLVEDISVVSYDNQTDSVLVQIDTVDNGCSQLGYFAFHQIMGDVPTPRGRNNLLIATPSVIPRGSVRDRTQT